MGFLDRAKEKLGHLKEEGDRPDSSTPTPSPPSPSDPTGPGGPGPAPDPPLPEPDVQPSSTPSGPQVIPSPATPEGEPGPDPEPEPSGADISVLEDTEVRDSNPNAAGPEGLEGDMGVSSERVPDDPGSIEGTGSRGTATESAEGTWPVGGSPSSDQDAGPASGVRLHPEQPAEGRDYDEPAPAQGPEMDPRQQEATQEWREDQPAVNVEPDPPPRPGASSGEQWSGVDRTVGEENPAETPEHEFRPGKNPGHSHG